ncbi:MAG: hypothetical protein LBT65_05545 [Synergistaceae bacterium]|jgi:hypothetical protein|nr:hypothetical protein [Synergistaceae bacterium]
MTFLTKNSTNMAERSVGGVCRRRRVGLGLVLVALALLSIRDRNTAYAAEPLLVAQPAYAGMRFYVYEPQGVPKNWYATFDGYPVWKNAEGIWHYGSYSGSMPIPTNYVVGSVVPSLVGLVPVAAVPASMTSMVPTPVLAVAPQPVMPVFPVPVVPVMSWQLNPRFMVLGLWKGNVDRIGLLHKPTVPVAWKGTLPQVIYAWTGSTWYQMVAEEGERPGDVLRHNLYTLTRLVNQNGPSLWYEPNVSLLVSQAGQWGFFWMGEISPVVQ